MSSWWILVGQGHSFAKIHSGENMYTYIYVYIHIFMHTYSYRICAALRSSVLTALRADAYALDSLNRFEPLGHMEQHQCSFQTA